MIPNAILLVEFSHHSYFYDVIWDGYHIPNSYSLIDDIFELDDILSYSPDYPKLTIILKADDCIRSSVSFHDLSMTIYAESNLDDLLECDYYD